MANLTNTGERILLDKETPLMIARHLCAYKFAEDYIHGKTVLDIGCGEGYGSYYLAGSAKEITGMDYDKAIIDYAGSKYPKENLKFMNLDVKNLNLIKDKFDAICSFQFIEHLPDTKAFLQDVFNLLGDNGIFICSTPNRIDASPRSSTPFNKFHIKEYLCHEFKELLEGAFKQVDLLGLKRGKKLNFHRKIKKMGLFDFLPARINPVKRFYNRVDCNNFIIVKDKLDTALDFIAISKKQ